MGNPWGKVSGLAIKSGAQQRRMHEMVHHHVSPRRIERALSRVLSDDGRPRRGLRRLTLLPGQLNMRLQRHGTLSEGGASLDKIYTLFSLTTHKNFSYRTVGKRHLMLFLTFS